MAPRVMARRWDAAQAGARLETAGGAILRYALAAILRYFGVFVQPGRRGFLDTLSGNHGS